MYAVVLDMTGPAFSSPGISELRADGDGWKLDLLGRHRFAGPGWTRFGPAGADSEQSPVPGRGELFVGVCLTEGEANHLAFGVDLGIRTALAALAAGAAPAR